MTGQGGPAAGRHTLPMKSAQQQENEQLRRLSYALVVQIADEGYCSRNAASKALRTFCRGVCASNQPSATPLLLISMSEYSKPR